MLCFSLVTQLSIDFQHSHFERLSSIKTHVFHLAFCEEALYHPAQIYRIQIKTMN